MTDAHKWGVITTDPPTVQMDLPLEDAQTRARAMASEMNDGRAVYGGTFVVKAISEAKRRVDVHLQDVS